MITLSEEWREEWRLKLGAVTWRSVRSDFLSLDGSEKQHVIIGSDQMYDFSANVLETEEVGAPWYVYQYGGGFRPVGGYYRRKGYDTQIMLSSDKAPMAVVFPWTDDSKDTPLWRALAMQDAMFAPSIKLRLTRRADKALAAWELLSQIGFNEAEAAFALALKPEAFSSYISIARGFSENDKDTINRFSLSWEYAGAISTIPSPEMRHAVLVRLAIGEYRDFDGNVRLKELITSLGGTFIAWQEQVFTEMTPYGKATIRIEAAPNTPPLRLRSLFFEVIGGVKPE